MKSEEEILMREVNKRQTIEQLPITNRSLTGREYTIGFFRALFYTAIAILVFFIPLNIGDRTEILFGFIYNNLINLFGTTGIWILSVITLANTLCFIYGRFLSRENSKIREFYSGDSFVYLFIYALAAVYSILYTLNYTFGFFSGAGIIVGAATGEVIIGIALQVKWVIILGAITIPFLLKYGFIDFIGTLLEPIMRPVLKVPGKGAVDAISSFMTSSSVAVLITNELYKSKTYTVREAVAIATCFSSVSIGFAAVVIDTAGLMDHFLTTFFSSLLIAFLVSIIVVRIPPWSKKPDVYIDGEQQTSEMRLKSAKFERGILKKATSRFATQGYLGENVFKATGKSLLEGLSILPKVISMLIAIGITCLIIAESTPLFEWIGILFIPLLQLLSIPNAVEISPAITVGIAEMFLPVLFIGDSIDTLDIGARYFITALSMVQIIFFSETGAVILSTKLPVKLWELVVVFFLRTIIAIPIVALFMHLLF